LIKKYSDLCALRVSAVIRNPEKENKNMQHKYSYESALIESMAPAFC
jgi:hypothetical protein